MRINAVSRKMIATISKPGNADTMESAIRWMTFTDQSPRDSPQTRVHGYRRNSQLSQR
ncbi:hypothetical protein D3C80_2026820 [compost metagenome]